MVCELFAVLFLDEVGLEIGERVHDAVERGAHLGLELAILGMALLEHAFGDGEARLVAGTSAARNSARCRSRSDLRLR